MNKFKVGDKVRVVVAYNPEGLYKGAIHTVEYVHPMGNVLLADIDKTLWVPDRFELVRNCVLTPEEVFEHLRKGTKLQHLHGTHGWKDVTTPNELYYEDICNDNFRIKPEPEVIELNGKKYREIME